MKISINWLQDYISLVETPEEIANLLTLSGLEVGEVKSSGTQAENLPGLVIGQVVACHQHPNADSLRCTQVDIGLAEPLPIVCGAPNVTLHQKVAVALVGTTLHTYIGEKVKIKKAKIRGEVSEGMLCAEDEIGLGPNHEQILDIQTDLPTGTPLADYFKATSDTVLTLELTPNRIDACSHLGVARELRALLKRAIQYPPRLEAFPKAQSALPITVEVQDHHACPRYAGVVMRDVAIQPSPAWLQEKLQAVAINPINNVVDIANFVMYELGQPLHAFDYDTIHNQKLIVKRAQAGEKITTLDGVERSLLGGELVIADAQAPIALAGVLGGKESAISHQTVNIFIESAYFEPGIIRSTAKQHKLATDASFRFERGTDPDLPVIALQRACWLLAEIAGGKIASDPIDSYPEPIPARAITVTYHNIQRLIGQAIPASTIQSILQHLDIHVTADDGKQFIASVPPYRVDVTREVDVIEEILRIYGYDNVPPTAHCQSAFLATEARPAHYNITHSISNLLSAHGYNEICTNSLTAQRNSSLQAKGSHTLQHAEARKTIPLLNPLSDRLNVLRDTLLFTGLEVLAYNLKHKQSDLKLFEAGKIYYQEAGKYIERNKLGIWLTGNIESPTWIREARKVSFQDLNNLVHMIFEQQGMAPIHHTPCTDTWYQQGIACQHAGTAIATMGQLQSDLLQQLGIKQAVFYADIDVDALSTYAPSKAITYQPIAKFPGVKRDLSIVIDKHITFEDVKNVLTKANFSLIQDLSVFDVYAGDKLPAEKKAYALTFILQHPAKTLDDATISQTMQRVMRILKEQLGAIIRE